MTINRFLHIGFDSYVDSEKIFLIAACDTDKIRREMKKRDIDKNSLSFWNACGGKEMRSVILMTDGMLVATSLNPDTLVSRYVEMIQGGFLK